METGDQRHVPGALPPGKSPGTNSVSDWMGLRASLGEYGNISWASAGSAFCRFLQHITNKFTIYSILNFYLKSPTCFDA